MSAVPRARREAEVKFSVEADEYARLRAQVEAQARHVGSSIHRDEYFRRAEGEDVPSDEWLSVRSRSEGTCVSLKRYSPSTMAGPSRCEEMEVEVSDADAISALLVGLVALGFLSFVTVNKTRDEFVVDGRFLICFDEVESLGRFVEIEALDVGDESSASAQLEDFARSLGLDPGEADIRGYPALVLEARGGDPPGGDDHAATAT